MLAIETSNVVVFGILYFKFYLVIPRIVFVDGTGKAFHWTYILVINIKISWMNLTTAGIQSRNGKYSLCKLYAENITSNLHIRPPAFFKGYQYVY